MYGYASVYIIFEDDASFYASRSRVVENLNSIPANILPAGVTPRIGPPATAVNQVFSYSIQAQDSTGKTDHNWNLDTLRSIQDYFIRHNLLAVEGVAEVASIGGFVKEYQVIADPLRMQTYKISLPVLATAVSKAISAANLHSTEINQAEYFVKSSGYITRYRRPEKCRCAKNGGVQLFL